MKSWTIDINSNDKSSNEMESFLVKTYKTETKPLSSIKQRITTQQGKQWKTYKERKEFSVKKNQTNQKLTPKTKTKQIKQTKWHASLNNLFK